MTTTDRPTDHHDILSPPGAASWEGRAFGGIVLAAFLLYGVGSALADQPIGLALVALNSIAVAAAGLIGFRLLQSSQPRVGFGYLATRSPRPYFSAAASLSASSATHPTPPTRPISSPC